MAGQQYGREWQRAQILKKNAVRIKFKDLNPAVQKCIGFGRAEYFPSDRGMDQSPLRKQRFYRGMMEISGLANAGTTVYAALNKKYIDAGVVGSLVPVTGLLRTVAAQAVQEKHSEIAETAKKFGLLQTKNEKEYPPDWINPATVAQTHPIFSVTRNGDIIFRRVTPLEFKLLKAQQGWREKAGLNVSLDPRKLIWRWRGTLRKPLAPEVERRRVSERLRAWAARWKPAFGRPAVRPLPAIARRPMHMNRKR